MTARELIQKLEALGKPDAEVIFVLDEESWFEKVELGQAALHIEHVEQGDNPAEVWLS